MMILERMDLRTYVRLVLIVTLLAVPVTGVFAGGEAEEDIADVALDDQQAPALSALVEAGELPPLEERIPVNPKVVDPVDEIGRYGGEARSAVIGAGDGAWFTRTVLYDGMVVWDLDWTEPLPGAAASFEVSDDAREFTFELREGLRWHDGEPFTSADVEWWWKHEALHDGLNPSVPGDFVSADEPAELTVVDELTFTFSFAEPNALFIDDLASTSPWVPTAKHYGTQFHADFNDDIEDVARDEGFDDWIDYYDHMIQAGVNTNPDLPSIRAWTPVEGAGYTGDVAVVRWERNPYYYRVDAEGNQLPYIDSWAFDMIEDTEVLLLRTLAGEIDLMQRHITTAENRPVLYDGQEGGNYRLFEAVDYDSPGSIIPNHTNDDPVFRELIRNRDFRIGLSHAIDREEIADLVFAGMVEPRQGGPYPHMPWYHEEYPYQYLEFDRDLANEYFDRAGLDVDDQGRRLGPDDEPIEISIEINATGDVQIDMMELVQSQWREVGIDLALNVVDRTLLYERVDGNQHEFTIWGGPSGDRGYLYDPNYSVPYRRGSRFAPRWAAWYGDPPTLEAGVEPEEPTEAALRAFELYDELLVAPPDEQSRIMWEIMDHAANEFWIIGLVSAPPAYGVVHNRIGNFPEPIPSAWIYPAPGPAGIQQLFIRE